MEVTSITVTRSRKVPTEQYGSADASITLAANVAEGEDWEQGARELLSKTRGLVYENLGLKLPAKATAEATKENKTDTVAVETTAEEPVKSAAKKAPTAAKKAKKDTTPVPAPKASEVPADDVPGDDVPGDDVPEIRKNPENRTDPADDVPGDETTETETDGPSLEDEFPDEPEAAADFSVEDLQSYLTGKVKDKKVSAQNVREIIASYGVARTSDLPADKVLEVKAKIDEACGD